ncbi:MAG TPA: class I SAM-dependent methyltransferase [Thermoanaerobaculia bacterium]|nr:class I SAM-dependent methyltransferase [Thermoanaerobaculia bacterium]
MNAAGESRPRARPNAIRWRPHRLEKMIDRVRCRAWFQGKDFTSDWSSGNFTMWRRVLSPLKQEPLRILEIGSWEGRSALFFLNYFKRSTIVCIDTFEGTPEEKAIYDQFASVIGGVEGRFDRNLSPFAGRVEKIKSRSGPALDGLAAQRRRFDLAYIDGSHRRDEVMRDSVGVWQLITIGGVVIWDDYEWGLDLPPEQQPRPAINDFLRDHQGQYRLLATTYQIAVERVN